MLDIVLRSSQVVTPDGVVPLDIGIQGEVIDCLARHGTLEGRRVIDVGDSIVVPGGIDPHVHCAQPLTPLGLKPQPGSVHNCHSQAFSLGPTDVSRAALFGGTTSLVDFAVWMQEGTLAEALERNEKKWASLSYTDYSEHVMLLGDIPERILEELPTIVQGGNPSIKMFTTNVIAGSKGRRVHWGPMLDVFRTIAPLGGMAAIHAEDDDLVMHNYDQHFASGDTHFTHLPEVHTQLSEELAIRQVLRLGAEAGVRLYIMHVSSELGVTAIREARAAGQDVHAETLHQYALFNRKNYHEEHGQIFHTWPSLQEASDNTALWEGMRDGSIETVATDGIVTTFEQKIRGARIDDLTGGSAGIEERMTVTYSAGLKRGFSLEKLAELTSTNAARLLGMYPKKGVILPGSDADLVVLEPREPAPLCVEDLHQTDYSPWEGHEVSVWPVMTLLRGSVVIADDELLPTAPGGLRIPRRTLLP
ncbi:MAG TPA: amidohydrolase family protein [Nocardioidaceae bacterium]|nr:amidohydrolase family protein [Nocardioidaceae bacterium]